MTLVFSLETIRHRRSIFRYDMLHKEISSYVICAVTASSRPWFWARRCTRLSSREDAFKGGYHRLMHLHRANLSFDAQGNIASWEHAIVG